MKKEAADAPKAEPEYRHGKVTPPPVVTQHATKAEAQAGLALCLAKLPITEGYLGPVAAYVAAGV